MSYFLQDGTGDLLLTTKNGAKTLTLSSDRSAGAAQKLTNRFLLFLGEWFLDTTIGLPYFQAIAVKNPDKRVLKQLFQQVILSVPAIKKILDLQVSISPRRVGSVFLRAQTDENKVIVGGEGPAFVVQV